MKSGTPVELDQRNQTGGKKLKPYVQGGPSSFMKKYFPIARLAFPLLSAWIIVALPLQGLMDHLPPFRFEFGLPRVNVPYTPGTDVVSLVPDLFSALALAALSLFLVEFAKAGTYLLASHRRLCHWLLVAYQSALLIDILRHYAWDWYGYLLYYCRLITLSYDRPRPEILPISTPWLSFLLLLAAAAVIVKGMRPQPREHQEK